MLRSPFCALGTACLLFGCGSSAEPSPPDVAHPLVAPLASAEPDPGVLLTTLSTPVDPPVPAGEEYYACLFFDVGGAAGAAVHSFLWTPPTGPVALHHAMLYATDAPGVAGPVPCDPLPTPVAVLPLYAPGGETTTFPEGVSIAIPEATTGFFVQLHLLRFGEGQGTTSVAFLASQVPPEHLAGWVDDPADIPPIAPHARVTSTAQCAFQGPAHVVGSWPHMHHLGAAFQSTIIRVDGTRTPLLDLTTWDFYDQPLHPVDAVLAEGDQIETACTWENTTEATVYGGPFSSDEMCNQGLVMWPKESAFCVR